LPVKLMVIEPDPVKIDHLYRFVLAKSKEKGIEHVLLSPRLGSPPKKIVPPCVMAR